MSQARLSRFMQRRPNIYNISGIRTAQNFRQKLYRLFRGAQGSDRPVSRVHVEEVVSRTKQNAFIARHLEGKDERAVDIKRSLDFLSSPFE